MGRKYTAFEDATIRELAPLYFSAEEIGRVIGRSGPSVGARASSLTPKVGLLGHESAYLRSWLLEGGRLQREENPTVGVVYVQAHRSGDMPMLHGYLEQLRLHDVLIPDRDRHAGSATFVHRDIYEVEADGEG